jgi:creatinine amidohydrolase
MSSTPPAPSADGVRLAEATSDEVSALARAGAVTILPVGAIEVHGPHLPLATDCLIAEETARRAAGKLLRAGVPAAIGPTLAFTVTEYGREHAGTVSLRAETALGLVHAALDALRRAGFRAAAIANGHLEPAHLEVLERAVSEATSDAFRVRFPNYCRKPLALRLSDEFKRGACHAGRYETSLLLASHPALVRTDLSRSLPPNEVSLSRAMKDGARTFRNAGGPRAYFGDPAAASAAEGEALYEILSDFVVEALGDR